MNVPRIATALVAATTLAISAPKTNPAAGPTQMVVTVRHAPGDDRPTSLEPADLAVLRNNTPAPIVHLERLSGALADMQLFILLDDSSRSASLSLQFPELRKFLEALPTSTQVAVGYMRNGTFGLAQAFTADHQEAARALRLPTSVPGENGSPYFVLSDLAKHWPSKQSTNRRAVLMLTDGVDPYYGAPDMDDPYVTAAIHDAMKESVMVYSIYLRGAGRYGRSDWVTNFAQSRLMEVSAETGGYAYSMGLTDPVTISPFLKDFQDRLDNQYRVTIESWDRKGVQPVKLHSELPQLKIDAPTHVYVR